MLYLKIKTLLFIHTRFARVAILNTCDSSASCLSMKKISVYFLIKRRIKKTETRLCIMKAVYCNKQYLLSISSI